MSKIVGITVGTPLSPRSIKDKLHAVTSVNGVTPDEHGNVEVASGGASSWNDLKDKPFGEEVIVNEPTVIDWDGDTTGLDMIPITRYDGSYRISDITPTIEQLENSTYTWYDRNIGYTTHEFTEATASMIADQALILNGTSRFVVVYDESFGYPKGLYVPKLQAGNQFCSSVTIAPAESTTTLVKPIDTKYLPYETITPDMVLALMNEVGAATPIADSDGYVITTNDDEILIL